MPKEQSKIPKLEVTQAVSETQPQIPVLGDGGVSRGKTIEESYSRNIGKGRVENVDEKVQNQFINDPQLYEQLSNQSTLEKAQQIYDAGNAETEVYRLLDAKDPASIPLGNKVVGDMIDQGRHDEAVELLRTMSSKLRESGQFTQAAAITMMKSDPETALRYAVREIDSLNAAGKKKYGKKWTDFALTDEEINAFKNIKKGDTEAIKAAYEQVGSRIAKEYPSTIWEKVVELSKVCMLLNPRTQNRNKVANALLLPVRSLTDRVSALGQNAIHLINPDFKVTQSLTGGGKAEKQIAGEVWESVKDSLLDNTSRMDSLKGIDREKQVFKGTVASEKVFDLAKKTGDSKLVQKATNALDKLFPRAMEKVRKVAGEVVNDSSFLETARNFTYYLLEAGDEPFVRNNFVNRLASYMKAQGITSFDEIPEEAITLAKDEALKATFKDDNRFTEMLSGVKRSFRKGGEVIMPFTKTPANLAMRGIDYSPAGIINTINQAKNGADAAKVMDDLSKNITGTAAIALGYVLAQAGIITGALSDDKDEAAFQKQQGQLAYSVKVGDNYYNYDWAQPAAIPLILGASIYQSVQELDDEEKTAMEKLQGIGNIAHQAATSAADTWVELSPLQTVSDIFNTGYGSSVSENVLNEMLEFPQRLVPSALGATARAIDTTQRQTYSSGNPIQTQIDTLKSKVPFFSQTLPAAYDTWGNEIKRSDDGLEAAVAQFISPGQLGNDSSTPIDGEIQRLYESTENAAVFPRKAEWKVNDQQLTNQQYSDLQKEQGNLNYDMASSFMGLSEYRKLDDDTKAETLKDIYSLSKALAENQVMGKEISSAHTTLAKIYNDQGIDTAVTYMQIGNMDGKGSGGALLKEDWITYLYDSDLTNLQKAYLFQTRYSKSDNPFR